MCNYNAVCLQLRPPIKINPSIRRPSQVKPVSSHPSRLAMSQAFTDVPVQSQTEVTFIAKFLG